MIKLIASDMDGTLLNSNKQLSPSLYGILKKLNDKGIVFVAISGREIFSLKEIFKDVEEDIVYASNNGNYITYKDEVIFENYIEHNMVYKVAKIIRKKAKYNTIYCSKDTVYSESIIPCIVGKKWKLKVKYVRDITKVEDKILKIISSFSSIYIIHYLDKHFSIDIASPLSQRLLSDNVYHYRSFSFLADRVSYQKVPNREYKAFREFLSCSMSYHNNK